MRKPKGKSKLERSWEFRKVMRGGQARQKRKESWFEKRAREGKY